MSAPFRSLGKVLREAVLSKAALSKAVRAVRVPSAFDVSATVALPQKPMEALEERRMLTTLVGGDIFEYRQANGDTVRIVLRGNIVAEAIGASIDNTASTPNNQVVRINDLPGTFYNAGKFGTEVLGGVGGADGVELLSPISINDPINPAGSFTFEQEGLESINIEAVASDSTGRLYGFNVVDIPIGTGTGTQRLVQLLQFDTTSQVATVVANLGPAFNTQGNFNRVEGVNRIAGADFDPITGRLFFVAEGVSVTVTTDAGGNVVVTPTTNPVVQLFSVDVTLPTAAARTASVVAFAGNFGISTADPGTIESIVFDRVGTGTALYAVRARADVNQILTINPANGTTSNVRTVTFRGENVLGITGIHIVADNASAAEPFIYAVQGADANEDPSLLFIDRNTGAADNFGPLPDPDDDPENGPVRGASLSSLTYAEGIRNPFTGEFGVLIAADSDSDELVFVDSRNRVPESNLFQLVITSSDETGEVIMGVVPDDAPDDSTDDAPSERPMTPFSGSAGSIQVLDASGNSNDPLVLALPEGAGGVYIGVRTVDFEDTTDTDESDVPLLFGSLAAQLGAVPAGQRAAGIVSTASLLMSLEGQTGQVLQDRLTGQNFDNITGISVDRNGLIIAIDSDQVDELGNVIAGDQIAVIDPVTGKAGTPRLITSANLGTALRGLQAVEFADTDNNPSTPEELLAVFASQLAGSSTSGGSLGINFDNLVLSLSVTADGNTAFILATDATNAQLTRLYRSVRDSSNQFSSVVDLGVVTDANGNVLTALSASGVRGSDAAVFTVGFNRDNPIPNQVAGGAFNNTNGVNADIRDVAVSNDGSTYALVAEGSSFAIYQIGRDPGTGAVTPDIPDNQPQSQVLPDGLRRLGTIQTGSNALQRLNAIAADPTSNTNIYGVGASATGLLPSNSLGEVSSGVSVPFTSNFVYRGLTSSSSGELFAITSSGPVLQLRRVGLTSAGLAQPGSTTIVGGNSAFIRWDVNTGTGTGASTAVLGIRATDARPGDAASIYAIGIGADQFAPTTPVLGDLGGRTVNRLVFRGVNPAFLSDDATVTTNGETFPTSRLGTAFRDTATGALFGANPARARQIERVGPFAVAATPPSTVANQIVDGRALGVVGNVFFTTGFNVDAPVPNAPLAGSFGQNFGTDAVTDESNIRAISARPAAQGTLTDIYAAIFNGTGTDIFRLQRNATTGAITSTTKVNTGALGLTDPTFNDPQTGQPQVISRIYAMSFDATNANRIYVVGDVGPSSNPEARLYTLDVAGNGSVSINTGADAPRTISGGGFQSLAITKAITVRPSDGALFVVQDDGLTIGETDGFDPASFLFQLDVSAPGVAGATSFGAIVGLGLGGTDPGPAGVFAANNADIRSIQFRTRTDGREVMVALDVLNTGGVGGSRLIELDFNNTTAVSNIVSPMVANDGSVLATVTGTFNNPNHAAAVGLQISVNDRVNDIFRTYTLDQYGRAYSVVPAANAGAPDRLFVSANEVYSYDLTNERDSDGDGFGVNPPGGPSELVSEGPLVNADGTAFLDSIDHLVAVPAGAAAANPVLAGTTFVGTTAQRFFNTLRTFNNAVIPTEKLVTLTDNGVGNVGYTVNIVRAAGTTTDGTISIAGATGEIVRIRGLTFTADNDLVGLQSNPVDSAVVNDPSNDVTSLIAFDIANANPANTIRVTDPVDTVLTADAGGLATDSSGRIYSPDRTSVAGQGVTRLLVGNTQQSIFQINTTTGVATKLADIADTAEAIQQPVLDRFTALSWLNSTTLYAVQQDVSAGNANRLVVFENVPASPAGTVSFRRVNAGNTAGLISLDGTTSLAVTAMDFTADGRLVALDTSNNAQVLINYDESAGSGAPANSVLISGTGSAGGLVGLTLGGGGSTAISGRFLSIDSSTAPDTLVASTNNLSLFAIDRASGQASVRGIINVSGAGLSDANFVRALTHGRAGTASAGLLYAVIEDQAGNQNLFQINPNNGAAVQIGTGPITLDDPATGAVETVASRLTAIATSLAGDIIGIHDPVGAGDRRLVRLATTPGAAVSAAGVFIGGSAAGSIDDTATGLAVDPSGRLVTVQANGGAPDALLITPTQLYQLNGSSASATTAAFSPVLNLSGTATIAGSSITTAVLNPIVAVDFDGAGRLFAVRRVPNLNPNGTAGTPPTADTLNTINLTTGVLTSFGVIQAASAVNSFAFVSQIAFRTDNELLLIDNADPTGPRQLSITVAGGVPTGVGSAAIVPDPTGQNIPFNPAIRGFASDGSGRFFGIDTIGSTDAIVVDPDGFFAASGTGVAPASNPTLGRLLQDGAGNPTGVFQEIGTIRLADGTPLGTIAGMAWATASSQLFVADSNSVLYTINPATGVVTATLGTITDATTGLPVTIGSMDFDGNGRLIIQDLTNNRAAQVNFPSLRVGEAGTTFTLNNSIPGGVGAISYDPSEDRFISADNSTGINPLPNESTDQPGNPSAAAESALIGQFVIDGDAGRQDVGRIFIGGVVTGIVNLAGSIDTFYAGSLLTGDAAGISRGSEAAGELRNNFIVNGSIRQLATNSSIGTVNTGIVDIDDTQPTHLSGFNAVIAGRVGQIRSAGDFPGVIRVNGQVVANDLNFYTPELEGRLSGTSDTVGDAFARGQLVYTANTNNTRGTAERLGTVANAAGANTGAATVTGYLDGRAEANDLIDYYAVSMLGGQTFTVSLSDAVVVNGQVVPFPSTGFNRLQVGVFDPDGRLIQTSYLRTGGANAAQNFQVFATRAGEYVIAVANRGDLNFNGAVDGVDNFTIPLARIPYALSVFTGGDVTLGGLNVLGNVADVFTSTLADDATLPDGTTSGRSAQVRVISGDLGSISANVIIALTDGVSFATAGTTLVPSYLTTVLVDNGNLRSMTATSIGLITSTTVGGAGGDGTNTGTQVEHGVGIAVPLGSVGAIRTTSAAGVLFLNPNALAALGPVSTGATSPNTLLNPVGGNFQMIEAAGTFGGNVYANRAIGTIRAVDMDILVLQSIVANADNIGQDGTIDLIDIADQFGTLQNGGPAISTNLGGNVRYISVGGLFFRDRFFGGGGGNDILLLPGQTATITDDSGSNIVFSADSRFVSDNPNFDPNDPNETDPENIGPFISYEPYPIRSGGVVIIRMTVSSPGIVITGSSVGGRAVSAEIGSLTIQQPADFVSPVAITDRGYEGSSLTIRGSANVSIFDLDITAVTDADVLNETRGNIPILRAGTINRFRMGGSLGFDYSLATDPSSVRMLVEPQTVLTNEQPFSLQTTGALIGATNELRVGGAIANIIGSGDIALIQANNGGGDDTSLFEGILGPVFTTGAIDFVGIGEGIASSGAGFFQASGIFAIGAIGEVRGGTNAHIRGKVVSLTGIGFVATSGVISGTEILVLNGTTAGDFIQALDLPTGTRVLLDTLDSVSNPTFEIDTVRASQGIIGTVISAGDIRAVSAGGFGILNSRVNTAGSGVVGRVEGDGYGLRTMEIDAGVNLGTLRANGNGSTLAATSFSDAVRQSRFTSYDPFTGRLLTADNDLHLYLGTSESIPTITGVTESGVIEDVQAQGTGTLSTVNAAIIRGSDPDAVDTANFFNLPAFRTVFAFGNSIGTVTTTSIINGLTLTTGRLTNFRPGADVSNLNLTVSGRISAIRIRGNLVGGSNIASVGPSAGINSLRVDGNFFGTLTSQGRIGTIDIAGNLGALNDDGTPVLDANGNRQGVIVINPATNLGGGTALSRLRVGGSIVSGSLTLGRSDAPVNIGTIEVAGSLGNVGETLTVNGNLNTLRVGTNRNTLASLNLAFVVTGSARTIDVQGRVAGSVQVFGNLNSLKVTNDEPSNLALITGGLTVGGNASKVELLGGNLASVLTVTGTLGTLNIKNGSIAESGSVVVQNGGISNLTITNGNIAGTVSAAGRINKLSATAIGDNLAPNASITAASAGKVTVANDIFSDTTITITGRLDSLQVNGNVNAGAAITAGSFGSVRVRGTNSGTFTPPLV
jgi:hypothetical protein